MIESVVVCGDSFATGVGIPPDRCYEDFFGGLVAEELNLPLRVFARSGCCNFTIFLQVKKVIEQYKFSEIKPLVLISVTYHERYLIPIVDKINGDDLDLKYVQYKEYEPYSEHSTPQRKLEFELSDESKFVSQTLSNINLYLSGQPSGAIKKSFDAVPKHKYNSLMNFVADIDNEKIKCEYDNAIITKAHLLLKNNNIPHIFMVSHSDQYQHLNQENVAAIDWGYLCQKFPDNLGSGHCDENGHKEVFEILKPKVEELLK
jgi:hypothetical protein